MRAEKSMHNNNVKTVFGNGLFAIIAASFLVLVLVALSFASFQSQTQAHIEADMHAQLQKTQDDSILLLQNEISYLVRITRSISQILSRVDLQTDADILAALEECAETSGVVRMLFVTLDGRAYTSYAGYLGQSDENLSIDGIRIADISEPILSQPFYSDDLDKVIFGVIAPVVLGGEQGVLVSSYNMDEFSALLQDRFPEEEVHIFIANREGGVIGTKSGENFMANFFSSLTSAVFHAASIQEMEADLAQNRSGTSAYEQDGVTYRCAYKPLEMNDWYVILTIEESFLEDKNAAFERYGLQLMMRLIVLMAGLLCVITISRIRTDRKIRSFLEYEAMFDGLTHVYNRKTVEEKIERFLQAADAQTVSALLLADVDDFKQVNDRRGHVCGDLVLQECAGRLISAFGAEGIVGRLGGDEFLVFLPDVRDDAQLRQKIAELMKEFSIQLESGEKQRVAISIGMAQAKGGGHSFAELYDAADTAMYRKKGRRKSALALEE